MLHEFDLKHTRNYATEAKARAAAAKVHPDTSDKPVPGYMQVRTKDIRVFIAVQDGRYIPIFQLTNSGVLVAGMLARHGFYCFN